MCLAVSYSEQVYTKPREKEEQTYIEPDWLMGTKAMVIKSVPLEHHDTLVFAIRGSQTFVDWLTNVWSAPASPDGFLVGVRGVRGPACQLTWGRTTLEISVIGASCPSRVR